MRRRLGEYYEILLPDRNEKCKVQDLSNIDLSKSTYQQAPFGLLFILLKTYFRFFFVVTFLEKVVFWLIVFWRKKSFTLCVNV